MTALQVFTMFRDKPVCPSGKDPEQYLYESGLSTLMALLAAPEQVSSMQQLCVLTSQHAVFLHVSTCLFHAAAVAMQQHNTIQLAVMKHGPAPSCCFGTAADPAGLYSAVVPLSPFKHRIRPTLCLRCVLTSLVVLAATGGWGPLGLDPPASTGHTAGGPA